ncbi:uncharacterized protein TDEL_0B00290 [Torulaspora delbrueckii]|uniref:Uncharacterized protein n=1 Tax=Torulaspora delbrueckii TaxID=4950 RepID=G8ZNG4_TORDE|nr:hypothetical protein TDEL_0B00290 [Torulaspora delbrueckii]CCE90158.1 hypothetical protein TDEL_0B00290 [Torulaspora delbrueckii]
MSLSCSTGWRVLRANSHVACQGRHYLDGSEPSHKDCTTLFELCCLQIAHELVRQGINLQEKKCIIQHLIRDEMVLCVWRFICLLAGDSFSLFCLFQSCEISGEILRKRQPYTCYSLPLDVDLIGSIRLLNGLNSSYNFEHLTVLEIYHPVNNLSQVTNLHSLAALTVINPLLHEIVRSWRRSLAVDGTRWRNLRQLRLPQLKSPMLFSELLELVPSLAVLEAGMGPQVIDEIPQLSRMVKYVDVGRRDRIRDTEKIAADKLVFGLSIGFPHDFTSESYVYKRQMATQKAFKVVHEKSVIRRPFNKRIKANTSAKQFFGFS